MATLQTLKSKLKAVPPVGFFCVVAGVFGLLFVATTPPFQAPDEPVHFFRSYQIADFNVRVDKEGTVYGGKLPSSLEETVTTTAYSPPLLFTPNQKYDLGNTKEALAIKTIPGQDRVYEFSTTAYYSPISYVPQAIGIFIGKLANAPPLVSFYLGRVGNLAAWILLFAIAIRLMPRKKWALVFVGLLPMALFQAASLSADVMAVGVLAVVLGFILRLVDRREVLTLKTLLIIGALLCALALSKQVMFVFLPLILLLPGVLFINRKTQLLVKGLFLAVPITLFGMWMLAVGDVPLSTSVNGIDPPVQIEHMLHSPQHFLIAAFNTYGFSWGDGIVKSFIGNFGWVDTPLGEGFVMLGYLALFLLFVSNTDKRPSAWLTNRQRWFLLGVGLVYVAAVTGALYAYFTPVDFKIIIGLVGRYYLPFALLLIPVLAGAWLRMSEQSYRRIAITAPLLLLSVSYMTIFVRYYIHNV